MIDSIVVLISIAVVVYCIAFYASPFWISQQLEKWRHISRHTPFKEAQVQSKGVSTAKRHP